MYETKHGIHDKYNQHEDYKKVAHNRQCSLLSGICTDMAISCNVLLAGDVKRDLSRHTTRRYGHYLPSNKDEDSQVVVLAFTECAY